MTIIPKHDDLSAIRLNAKQCRILYVTLNETIKLQYRYFDPYLDICHHKTRELETFARSHLKATLKTDPDRNAGEIKIYIPEHLINANMIVKGKPFTLKIAFSFEEPSGGLQFVVPTANFIDLQDCYLYTLVYHNTSRLCFPCVDSYSELCTWNLEFRVSSELRAVSSGVPDVDICDTFKENLRIYKFKVVRPTCAPNIGFAVGCFDMFRHSRLEWPCYCPRRFSPMIPPTLSHLDYVLELFQMQYFGGFYPYDSHQIVFVDQAFEDYKSYAGMTIFSVHLLNSGKEINQYEKTSRILVRAVAEQYFGCFIPPINLQNIWITKGISQFLEFLHYNRQYGVNASDALVYEINERVINYEEKYGGITLDWTSGSNHNNSKSDLPNKFHFSANHLFTMSPQHIKFLYMKSFLVVRMISIKVGLEALMKALNKLISMSIKVCEENDKYEKRCELSLDVEKLSATIFSLSSKDITAITHEWAQRAGHVKFTFSAIYNAWDNNMEIDISQQEIGQMGVKLYTGPLVIMFRFKDTTVTHSVYIQNAQCKTNMVCPYKLIKTRNTYSRLKINIRHLGDSYILWARVDPAYTIIRQVRYEQSNFQWYFQLKYDMHTIAQLEATLAVAQFPGQATCELLVHVIENKNYFYKVRLKAIRVFTELYNKNENWGKSTSLVASFCKLYGTGKTERDIAPNNFLSFPDYYVRIELVLAMGKLRCDNGTKVPSNVVHFIQNAILCNNNTENLYSDCYYKAALLDALESTIIQKDISSSTARFHSKSPEIGTIQTTIAIPRSTEPINLPINIPLIKLDKNKQPRFPVVYYEADLVAIINLVVNTLNMETHYPSYKYVLTVACLKVLWAFQKCGHMPRDMELFKSYANTEQYIDVRLTALGCFIDNMKESERYDDIEYVLNLIENDPDPHLRQNLTAMLAQNAPFKQGQGHILDKSALAHRIWEHMNYKLSHDIKLLCLLVDLYHSFYGTKQPNCIDPTIICDNPAIAKTSTDTKRQETLKSTEVLNAEFLTSISDENPALGTNVSKIRRITIGRDGILISGLISTNVSSNGQSMARATILGPPLRPLGELRSTKTTPASSKHSTRSTAPILRTYIPANRPLTAPTAVYLQCHVASSRTPR